MNKFVKILLLSFIASLAACQTAKPVCLVTKPVLKSKATNDAGGICIDRDDTADLLIYIKRLQECAQ